MQLYRPRLKTQLNWTYSAVMLWTGLNYNCVSDYLYDHAPVLLVVLC